MYNQERWRFNVGDQPFGRPLLGVFFIFLLSPLFRFNLIIIIFNISNVYSFSYPSSQIN